MVAPDERQILQLAQEEIDDLLKIKMKKGKKMMEDGNWFIGTTMAVQTHQEINRLYVHMKLMYPSASHVICAYQIPGIEEYYCADFCHNGEYGAGKRLLDMIKLNGITHRAVFVVRYNGVKKLGGRRFKLILDAAKSAINSNPENYITGKQQVITQLPQNIAPSQQKPAYGEIAGRGNRGYRGRPHSHSERTERKKVVEQIQNNVEGVNFSFAAPEEITGEWNQYIGEHFPQVASQWNNEERK